MISEMRKQNEYSPDFVSCPGETLEETLQTIGMTQADLAERIGRTPKTVNEIIMGKAPITPETALQLERALGVPASFWNNRERLYRESIARIDEQRRLEPQVTWLDQIPYKTMIKYGWIEKHRNKVAQFKEVLNFFGVSSPQAWESIWLESQRAVFRKSASVKTDHGAVAAWIRKGELNAQEVQCVPFNESQFKLTLEQIRALTVEPPDVFEPALNTMCAACGVAVTFVQELPKTGICGATWWLTHDRAVIQLSLRYKTNDHLWFSFFHEAGHILRHGKKEVFLEGRTSDDAKEKEADEFATNLLMPKRAYELFVRRDLFSKMDIKKFADILGIAPGIVVGRLQHDGYIPFTHCNDLKIKLKWATEN